jgi:hypothetical protein
MRCYCPQLIKCAFESQPWMYQPCPWRARAR